MPYNLRIPGQFTERELWAIEALAKLVPPGGVVVEVGSFLGMSSYAWAKSVDPSVTVYCIDAWEKDAEYPQKWRESYQTDYSLENFRSFTEKCPNIVVLQGFSPQDFADWDKSIDVYCQNICSQNTTFEENISFWSQFVKPDGIICGWGYTEEFPGVMERVGKLAQSYQVEPIIVERIWCLNTGGSADRLKRVAKIGEIHGYQYELNISEPPALLEPGDFLKVSGKLKNVSGRDWDVFVDGIETIKIGIQLYEENKPGRQEFRQPIGYDRLIDGGVIEFNFALETNQLQQGKITLVFDLLGEFWYWFEDKGARSQTVKVQVLPKTAGNLIKAGNQLKREGKLAEAILQYHLAIKLNPQFSWAYYNLGDAWAKQGHINEAIKEYRQAVHLKPDSALFNYQLSELLAQQKCDREAGYFLEKAEKFGFNKRFNQNIKNLLAQVKLTKLELGDNSYLFRDIPSYLSHSELERTKKFEKLRSPKKTIFITARHRTGSTYFHYLFSTVSRVETFYEPLHPQIVSHFLDADKGNAEKAKEIQSHTFKSNYYYFDEYKLLNRKLLTETHSENFANSKMFMSSLDRFPQLKSYIKFLISTQKQPKQLKVFQFNRIDFRLAWFRVNFPNAVIVNLRRNPRDIYASYVGVYERISKQKYEASHTNLGDFFYLENYMGFMTALCKSEVSGREFNNYEKIYLTNQLSNLWADKFADIVIDYESLVENPVDVLSKIVAHIPNFTLNFDEQFIQPRKDRVNVGHNYHSEDWFKEWEDRCDRILKEILSNFALKKPD